MTNRTVYRLAVVLIGMICLFLGSAIYILYRPTSLLIFSWVSTFGLMDCVAAMRATTGAIEQSVPSWVLFSLPFALWVLAYMLIVDAVWINSFSALRHAWFWCMPVIAIAAELAQIKNMIPGYFDLADLIAIMIAASIALFVTSIQKTIKEDYHE